MQAVLLWSIEVATLVLSDSDGPGPGGGGGGGVNVDVDGDTGGTGRDKHVLPRVVAADCRRGTIGGIRNRKSKALGMNYKIFRGSI